MIPPLRTSNALPAFTYEERQRTKVLLATAVAHMMGRKLEEDDWNKVYCAAKGIPCAGWSNLHIDVNWEGLGVEQKLLRCAGLGARSIKSVCGTTMMHPSATRSIRIDTTDANPNDVMRDVMRQYSELIALRTSAVRAAWPIKEPDMRLGWLLWEDNLTEFMYFEESLQAPNPDSLFAVWNETPAKGARKASKSLWIYGLDDKKKKYSVTTNAGTKIQPYFDVPTPDDQNLYFFRVQSEVLSSDTVRIWVSASTARALNRLLGSLTRETVSSAVIMASDYIDTAIPASDNSTELACPIELSSEAFNVFVTKLEGVSDEHRAQLLVEALYARQS